MIRLLPIINVAWWLALCAWIAAIVTAGVSAAVVFSTLPAMDVTLDGFEAFDRDSHGRLAAGQVMARMFRIVDIIQWCAAPMLLVAMVAHLAIAGAKSRLWVNLISTMCIVGGVATLAGQAIALTPKMNEHLLAYWAAARAGDTPAAHGRWAAFNDLHPTATTLFNIRLGLLLGALIVTAATGRPGPAPPRTIDRLTT